MVLQVFCVNTLKNRLKVDWLGIASRPNTSATAGLLCSQATRESLSAPVRMPSTQPRAMSVGLYALGLMGWCGEHLPQLGTETFLVQEMTPDDHPTVGGEPLVGEGNADGRRGGGGVGAPADAPFGPPPVEAGNLSFSFIPKSAKRCFAISI